MSEQRIEAQVSEPRAPIPWGEKCRAMAIHLCLSVAAIGVLLWVVLQIWYPDFFFATDGGWEGLRIVIAVDVVLGPLLTFVAFRRGKPGLVLDLSLIAALQVLAFVGGAWIMWSERPLVLAFEAPRFFSVSADNYLDVGQPVPDLTHLPGPMPKRVFVRLEGNAIEKADTRLMLYHRDQRVYSYAPAFQPLREHIGDVLGYGVPREEIAERDREGALDAFLQTHGGAFRDYAFIPYSTRFEYVYLGIRRSDGVIVGPLYVPAPPF